MNLFFVINFIISGALLAAVCYGAYLDAQDYDVDVSHISAFLAAVIWVSTLVAGLYA